MTIKEAVAERVRDLCRQRGIVPNTLANEAGVTPSTVYSMLDLSRKDVGITTIKRLCDGLGISVADFFDTDTFRNLEQEIK